MTRHLGSWIGLLAVLLVVAGAAVEAASWGPSRNARGAALRALGTRPTADEARALAVAAEAKPTAETWTHASLAAAARGDLEAAARGAVLAARLAPGDTALARRADEMLDATALARLRVPGRIALGAGLLVLLVRGHRARRRHRRERARSEWAHHLEGRLSVTLAGPTPFVDLFLTPRPCHRPMPPPPEGGTLAVVLSSSSESRTVRLPPVRGVREDAVRIRLSDATVREVLSRPGRWRVQARLDGRLVGQTTLDVGAAVPVARIA
jgi:hypothetical protein